ncbi:hypothetical protein PC129_g16138 [Phytophthora cactorum]|uniref:Uncharacterized protein n=1 Tax=Phytophthora cactorum TaxID=29920 RepID=A0A8T1HLC4_9STRA|nr:hypothetical protein PC129_g16138 [Phytophthora cactorum]
MSSDPNGFGKGGMPTQFMSPSGGGAGIGGQVDRVTKEGGAVVKDGHHLVAIKKEGRWALTAAAQMKECGLIKAGSLRAEGKAGGEVVKGGHLQVVVKDPLGVTKAEERSVSIAAAQLKAGGLHRVVVKAGERLVVVPKKAGGRHQVEGKDPGLRLVVVPRKVSGRHQVEGEDPGLRVLTMEARVLVDRLQRLVLVFPDQTVGVGFQARRKVHRLRRLLWCRATLMIRAIQRRMFRVFLAAMGTENQRQPSLLECPVALEIRSHRLP